MAGAEWSNWSRFEAVTIKDGPAPIELAFDYDDGWFVSVGGEFDLTRQVTVRSGIGYELGTDRRQRAHLPHPRRRSPPLSAGVSYRLNERFSFDVGYSFAAVEDMAIRAADAGGPDANGPFSGSADTHVHYIAAALKVKL